MKTETEIESVPAETIAVDEAPKKRRSKRAKQTEPEKAPESAHVALSEPEAADGPQEPECAEGATEAPLEPTCAEGDPERDLTPPKPAKRSTREAKASSVDAAPAKRKRASKGAGAGDGTTLSGLAERYLRALEDGGRSTSTVSAYRADLGIAMGHFGEDAAIASLTERRIKTFNDSDAVTRTRHGAPKAGPTVERTRRVLRLALAFAEEHGLLASTDAK